MAQHNLAHPPSRTGRKTGIAIKIVVSASLALGTGLVIVGGAALYLEKQALVGLQRENSLTFVKVMSDDIKTAMMADDMKKVDGYIKEEIERKRAVAFSIFNEKGVERGSGAKGRRFRQGAGTDPPADQRRQHADSAGCHGRRGTDGNHI
jgi:hypothetical protein